MDMSDSDSEGSGDGGAAAAGEAAFPSSQEVRQALGPLLSRKHELRKQVEAASAALKASSAAVAARRKELRVAVVAQVRRTGRRCMAGPCSAHPQSLAPHQN